MAGTEDRFCIKFITSQLQSYRPKRKQCVIEHGSEVDDDKKKNLKTATDSPGREGG